jgi:hypothetical protein
VAAELISAALDPVLHPDGRVRVELSTVAPAADKAMGFVLDSFHVDSLLEYLRSQPRVRRSLDAALPRDWAEWDRKGFARRKSDHWAEAEVVSLDLRRRYVPTPEFLARLKAKGMSARDVESDGPDVRTAFTLTLKCNWDEEHLLRAEFRNGKLVELDHA